MAAFARLRCMRHRYFLRRQNCRVAAARATIALCSVLTCALTDSLAAPRKAAPPTVATSEQKSITLRSEPPVLIQSSRGGAGGVSVLVSVAVANRNATDAKGVAIYLVLRSGLTIPLRGPKTIGAFAKVVYVSSPRLPSPVTETPRVVINCLNCRLHH